MRGRAGPVYDWDHGIFPYMNTPARWPEWNILDKIASLIAAKMAKFLVSVRCMYLNFVPVCDFALLVKLQESTKVTKLWQSRTMQVYVPPFWLCFLNSSLSTGLKFLIWTRHRIRPTGLIWRAPYIEILTEEIGVRLNLDKQASSHVCWELAGLLSSPVFPCLPAY